MRSIFKLGRRNQPTTNQLTVWLAQEPPAPTHGPATLPMTTPTGEHGMNNDTQPIPDGPEASLIGLSFNDVDAYCTAAAALRKTRSIEVVLAGLREYASRHPVAA